MIPINISLSKELTTISYDERESILPLVAFFTDIADIGRREVLLKAFNRIFLSPVVKKYVDQDLFTFFEETKLWDKSTYEDRDPIGDLVKELTQVLYLKRRSGIELLTALVFQEALKGIVCGDHPDIVQVNMLSWFGLDFLLKHLKCGGIHNWDEKIAFTNDMIRRDDSILKSKAPLELIIEKLSYEDIDKVIVFYMEHFNFYMYNDFSDNERYLLSDEYRRNKDIILEVESVLFDSSVSRRNLDGDYRYHFLAISMLFCSTEIINNIASKPGIESSYSFVKSFNRLYGEYLKANEIVDNVFNEKQQAKPRFISFLDTFLSLAHSDNISDLEEDEDGAIPNFNETAIGISQKMTNLFVEIILFLYDGNKITLNEDTYSFIKKLYGKPLGQ